MKNLKKAIIIMGFCLTLSACGPARSDSAADTGEQNLEAAELDDAAWEKTETEERGSSEDEANDADMETGSYPDGSHPKYSGTKLKLTVDGQEVLIAMYDNTAADAFLERLPLENLSFFDLSGNEKPVEQPEEPFSMAEEEPGYDPVIGEMVIYRPWGNFTIFYGEFGHSDELVPLGKVESGLDVIAGQTEDFTGTLELAEN